MSKNYTFNKDTKDYLVKNKKGSDFVVSAKQHQNIIIDYCINQMSVDDICTKYLMTPTKFDQYKRALGLVRGGTPLSDEEVVEMDAEELAELIVTRKSAAMDKANKIHSEQVKRDAESWRKFQDGEIKPFEKFISGISVKPSIGLIRNYKATDKDLIVCLSDTHCGGYANPLYSQKGQSWGAAEFQDFFRAYKEKVVGLIETYKPKEILLFSLGDILDGLRGTTEKGTRLEQDVQRDEQFNMAFDCISDFISLLLSFGKKVRVNNMRGNHDGVSSYVLFETLKQFFRKNNNIEFFNHHTSFGVFNARNTTFILCHGANDMIDAKVPKEPRRESFYQKIMLEHKELIGESKNCVAIMGDRHTREYQEFANFDFYIVGSPSKSLYADRLNLNSRPSQTCFILDDEGVSTVINLFFD